MNPDTLPPETTSSMNALFAFLHQGAPVIYVILALSVVGVACAVYCALALRRRTVLPTPLVTLAETLQEQGCADAEAVCRREGGPFAELLLTVILTRKIGREEAEALVEGAGRRAAHDLQRGVLILEVIAGISPLLGLLGTVLGMYNVFGQIAQVGAQEMHRLSGGIHEALVTTIAGLVVAIPAFVAYTWFSRRADDRVLEMERYAISLMLRLRG